MQTKLKNEKIQLKAVYENKLQMTREKYERDMVITHFQYLKF